MKSTVARTNEHEPGVERSIRARCTPCFAAKSFVSHLSTILYVHEARACLWPGDSAEWSLSTVSVSLSQEPWGCVRFDSFSIPSGCVTATASVMDFYSLFQPFSASTPASLFVSFCNFSTSTFRFIQIDFAVKRQLRLQRSYSCAPGCVMRIPFSCSCPQADPLSANVAALDGGDSEHLHASIRYHNTRYPQLLFPFVQPLGQLRC